MLNDILEIFKELNQVFSLFFSFLHSEVTRKKSERKGKII
jgi:hypothetical protein